MKRLLLIPLLAAACVTTAQEGEQMRKDIAALQAEVKKETDATAADRQKDQVRAKALQDALDQLSRAARKSGADLAVDVEKNQNDLAALRGQLEVIQHKLDALEKASADNQKSLDGMNLFIAMQKKEQEHPTDRGPLYNLARQKLDQGQPAKARELLQDFLSRYPKDELAANAQYWLGETYYAEKKWNDAIVEFQKVIKDYKGSDKAPDALLKIGMSFQSQGDCQNALLFFDEVSQAHKTAPAAKTAHDRAAECRKRSGKGKAQSRSR